MSITQQQIDTLRAAGSDARAVLHATRAVLPREAAVLSSFGAESALLLAFAAEVDKATPVLFLDTGMHFPETVEYRHELAKTLGLTNVIDVRPAPRVTEDRDPEGGLWAFDPDACCKLRKVEPLDAASLPYPALITGRKRSQAATRNRMEVIEPDADGRIKINPLAEWSKDEIDAEITRRGLPRHPLVARGYPSIGCAPCTKPVGADEDPRAGRWAGLSKVECGIHRPT